MPNATTPKTIRYSASQLPKPTKAHMDKMRAKQHGSPDSENPEWTNEQIKTALASRNQLIAKRKGQVPKRRITINVDEDLLAYFQVQGDGYQTRINQALRHYIVNVGSTAQDPHSLIESAIMTLRHADKALAKRK